MANMYNLIAELCAEKGVNITQMSRETGIPRSVFSELKAGRTKQLSNKYLPMLADYFGVSVDYLLGNGKKEKPVTDSDGFTEAERRDIAFELEKLMDEMAQNGDLMFDGEPATKEAMDSLRSAMEMGLIYAKKINKDKLNQ